MGNISREMEILRNNNKKMPKDKNTATSIKAAFNRLSSRLDTAEERISELENFSIDNSKTEKQIEQRLETNK